MKLKNVMIAKALVCLSFGIPLLFIPVQIMNLYGLELDFGGMVMARLYGATLLGNLILMWFAREDSGSLSQRAIILQMFLYNGIGFVITLMATLTGVMNTFGWTAVAIYLFFTIGFGYFEFVKQSVILKHEH